MVNVTEIKASRQGYGEGLMELGEINPNVVVIGLDLTESTATHSFKNKYPDRFFSIGIAEQNGMSIAAGLSLVGKIPYVSTFAVFSAGRCWEQVRMSVCYSNCNVKIAGSHAGLTTGPDGASHQATEDIAIMRVLPRMTVIVPCDAVEARKATVASASIYGPVYIRLSREPTPVITDKNSLFEIGKANVMKEGKDVGIIACGVMVYQALLAAEILEKENISAKVVNLHTIKPIDEDTIIKTARDCGCIVTVEEHQVMGGMGSAVAEVLVKNYPVPMEIMGLEDKFGESGNANELLEKYSLKDKNIIEKVKKILKIKRKGG
jgi:transketolase